MLQDHVGLVQTRESFFFAKNLLFFLIELCLQLENFSFQVADYLVLFFNDLLILNFLLAVFVFVGVGHFVYEHTPL